MLQRNASSHYVKVTKSMFSSNFEFADDHAAARQRGIPHHRLSKTLFWKNAIARRQRLALPSSRQWSASRDIEDRLHVHFVLQSSHWQCCGDARAPRAALSRSKGVITGKLSLQRLALQRRFTA
ncbi:hypothetical protein KWH47_15445 [Xanthomonas campestris pv. spermacoces]|uniref:hypothetical protein n=1 Tax=Xanthomonas euvesicatoria TaxID=456327 RepID=UPI001C458D2F|nr:hypothetical protein [Xanthomonas euvesicatoria]MBV6888934.1 hypothetical protein [Xanthomonas campestris pv. spermacoces]